MNENKRLDDQVMEWLGAYLDGELSPERSAWVEAHLETCPACVRELENLSSLSSLLHAGDGLHDSRLPLGSGPARALALSGANPGLPAPSRASRLFATSLRYLPLAVFGGWAFLQVVLLVTRLLGIISALSPSGVPGLGFLFRAPLESPDLLSRICGLLPGAGLCESLVSARPFLLPVLLPLPDETGLFSLLLSVFAALLFASWLAGMWVQRKAQAEKA